MSFIWPTMLLSLLILPLFVGIYYGFQRRRRRWASQHGNLGLLQSQMRGTPGIRRHIPPVFYLAGLAILGVALARPQTVVSLPRVEGTVILAFDVSGSMAANDVSPTRIEAAKTAAREFVKRQPSSVQVGVVAFSESGFTVQAPTNDQQTILASIERLKPERGTSLAYGILASLNVIAASLGQGNQADEQQTGSPAQGLNPSGDLNQNPLPEGTFPSALIVLITDGENTAPPDPFSAAQTAADHGVRIDTIGIGSPSGADLSINGFTVHTQLDEATLQQIAQMTGGTYYNAQNQQDLHTIYDHLAPQLTIKPEKTEVTSLLAGLSILVMMVGGTLSLIWFSHMP